MNEKDSDLLLRSWLYLNDNKDDLTEGEEKNLKIILTSIKVMDKKEREILIRKYLSRIGNRLKSDKELAEEIKLQEKTVKKRLSKAMKQFSKLTESFYESGFYTVDYRDIPINLKDDRISILMSRCRDSEVEILKYRLIHGLTNKATASIVNLNFNHIGRVTKKLKDQLKEIDINDLVDKEIVSEDLFFYTSMKREVFVLNKLANKYVDNNSIISRIEQLNFKIMMVEKYVDIYKNIEPYYFMAIKMKYFGDIPLEKSFLKLATHVPSLIEYHSSFKKRYKQRIKEKKSIYDESE
ncbi:hypothetical protein [Vagococcus fluvialis]|uniref:hypothetical protein n=1 Tax=Vagococcus fluvialis TaxID=2738 RepID=UPI0037B0A595